MATTECTQCTTLYAPDLDACPHCGADSYRHGNLDAPVNELDKARGGDMPKNRHQGPSVAGWNVPLPGETREQHAERIGVDVKDLPESGAQADAQRQQAGDRPDTSAPDLDVPGQRESIHSGSEGANTEPDLGSKPASAPDDTAGQATTAGDREKADDLRAGSGTGKSDAKGATSSSSAKK